MYQGRPLKFIPQKIPDIILIKPEVRKDSRGYFVEIFRQDLFEKAIGCKINFIQDNESKSKKGVITIINNSRHCKFGYDQRVEIFGDKGMLISNNKRKYNFFIDRYKIAYKLQLNDLYNLVIKNKKPRSTFDDGEKSLQIANAAFKSLRLKKVVTI